MAAQLAITALAACLLVSCSSGTNPTIPGTNPERQRLGLIEKSDRWDHDGNCQLSAREIDAGVATPMGTSREVTFDGADAVRHHNRSGDGTVCPREAQSGCKRETPHGAAPLQG